MLIQLTRILPDFYFWFWLSIDYISHVAAESVPYFVLFLDIDLLSESGSVAPVHTRNLQKIRGTLKTF